MANGSGTKNNLTIIADPLDEMRSLLQGFGIYDSLYDKFLSSDFPIGSEEEYLRHYLFGVGKPFINFLVFVDVGVGYNVEVDFGSDSKNIEIKNEILDFLNRIKWQMSLIQYATYRETLGRSMIVKTKNLAGDDFYFNELEGVTGVDVVNPMSFTEESIKEAITDNTGKSKFQQQWVDETGEEHNVYIESDRVIYSTLNPYSTQSISGVSSFANCINDLRVAARFARYKAQLSDKASRMHRVFTVDTDKFGQLRQGKDILESKRKSKDYLYSIHQMIDSMNEKGSDIAVMDYIKTQETSWAGKIPDLTTIERSVFESIALKMEIPINTMTYGADVNRATLEVLSDLFVRRRETGSQREYISVSENIIEEYLLMKGYDEGKVTFTFNPFLPADINEMMTMVSGFASRMPGLLSDTEIRRKIQMPDKIEYGEADEQKMEQIKKMLMPQTPQNAPTEQEKPPEGLPYENPSESSELEEKLDEVIIGLRNKYKIV